MWWLRPCGVAVFLLLVACQLLVRPGLLPLVACHVQVGPGGTRVLGVWPLGPCALGARQSGLPALVARWVGPHRMGARPAESRTLGARPLFPAGPRTLGAHPRPLPPAGTRTLGARPAGPHTMDTWAVGPRTSGARPAGPHIVGERLVAGRPAGAGAFVLSPSLPPHRRFRRSSALASRACPCWFCSCARFGAVDIVSGAGAVTAEVYIYFWLFCGAASLPALVVRSRGRCCSALAPRSRRSLLSAAILTLLENSLGISFAIVVGEVVCLLLTTADV